MLAAADEGDQACVRMTSAIVLAYLCAKVITNIGIGTVTLTETKTKTKKVAPPSHCDV